MLDTIRQLSRTVKLKDVIIGSFIPEDSAKGVERRAVWCQEEDCWTVQKLVRSAAASFSFSFFSILLLLSSPYCTLFISYFFFLFFYALNSSFYLIYFLSNFITSFYVTLNLFFSLYFFSLFDIWLFPICFGWCCSVVLSLISLPSLHLIPYSTLFLFPWICFSCSPSFFLLCRFVPILFIPLFLSHYLVVSLIFFFFSFFVDCHQELSGNKIRNVRPTSSSKLRRPESEYARQRCDSKWERSILHYHMICNCFDIDNHFIDLLIFPLYIHSYVHSLSLSPLPFSPSVTSFFLSLCHLFLSLSLSLFHLLSLSISLSLYLFLSLSLSLSLFTSVSLSLSISLSLHLCLSLLSHYI